MQIKIMRYNPLLLRFNRLVLGTLEIRMFSAYKVEILNLKKFPILIHSPCFCIQELLCEKKLPNVKKSQFISDRLSSLCFHR